MSIRGITIGVGLGLFVASATYFNDAVIRQSMLIGHHLPVLVFGVAALLLLAVNPVFRLRRCGTGLSTGDVAVAIAIALSACGWPGNSFYRGFAAVVALPAHWVKTQPNWISAQVMSHVPGGAGALVPEHVRRPAVLARTLLDSADQPDTLAGILWQRLLPPEQEVVREVAESEQPSRPALRSLTSALNRMLIDATLLKAVADTDVILPHDLQLQLDVAVTGQLGTFDQVRLNRQILAYVMPDHIVPLPRGEGMLFQGGRSDTAVHDMLWGLTGKPMESGGGHVPWRLWWPTLWLWGGLALCLGIAALCLAMIVHPQWSRRELLPYPIVRFVQEISRTEPGRAWPTIARHRGFWCAVAVVVGVHVINGLNVWFPQVPSISLTLDLSAMQQLFPNMSRVFGSQAYFTPRIYPAVIAFAFFLSTATSFSLGIAHLMLMILGGALLARSIPIERDYLGGSKVNMMGFGSFLAMFCIIVFVGRRYYFNVAASMIGFKRDDVTPAYAPCVAWFMILALAGAVGVLYAGGLPIPLGMALVGLIMLLWLVMSRISAETGLFLVKPAWLPVGVVTALIGFEAMGPTGYIAMALGTIIIVGESREALMPFLTNGLRISEIAGPNEAGRVAPWMAAMIVVSLLVAGVVVLNLQHRRGLSAADQHATIRLPTLPFHELAKSISNARSEQSFDRAVTASGTDRLALIQIAPDAVGWASLGFVLVMTTAAARLRLPWWPLHPVAFLVWGTWPMFVFSFSFLLGWLVKAAVLRISGSRGFHLVLPVAIGVIFGDILASLIWSIVGAVHYAATGVTPPTYHVFPY